MTKILPISSADPELQQESLFLEQQDYKLHLRHIHKNPNGKPVLMVHGMIENGRIFYSENGKGFGCYLAQQGFDVYVLDLRGRGKSTPLINVEADHGQYESITEDIPKVIDHIHSLTKQTMHLVSHSWGGVLVGSVLVRHPQLSNKVCSNICFASKRSIIHKSFEKRLKLDFFWNWLAPKLAKRKGYLDAKALKFGADNETIGSLAHCIAWVNIGDWHDPFDGFDYQTAAKEFNWPPTWHLTGINDTILGNQIDVRHFIKECHDENAEFTLLSKKNGNLVDYDHNDILTHPQACNDHFPNIVKWMHNI